MNAVRYDRHGRPSFAPNPATQRAMAVLCAAVERSENSATLKARQDAGELNANERLLKAIFGEIK